MRLLLCIALLLSMAAPARAMLGLQAAGIIKAVEGEVFVQQVGQDQPTVATPNMKLNKGDTITTGSAGSAGLIFSDDTVVSLGPDSQFEIKDFSFDPAGKELSFFARMMRGTISFISGQIAKLAPEKVKLETPDATLAVRGTQILVEIR